jgi:hypothetical protein
MDHVVYTDAKARELEKFLSGEKTMIVRGATGRKLPYGRVEPGDCLFFIVNNGEGIVRASATVDNVFNSEKLTEEQSAALLRNSQSKLNLTPEQIKRWSGKRYLVLIEVTQAHAIDPFAIDRSQYGNMDDWLLVNNIENVRK